PLPAADPAAATDVAAAYAPSTSATPPDQQEVGTPK
ncbi:MAG: hypothetical protein JWP61_1912, partial [Friedmanniella sp.]|nr:hypothetical protein [Friedmanniella sp.]